MAERLGIGRTKNPGAPRCDYAQLQDRAGFEPYRAIGFAHATLSTEILDSPRDSVAATPTERLKSGADAELTSGTSSARRDFRPTSLVFFTRC